MDERQRQITEGAGLEESRINKEFIDLLQKWSTPVLLVILVIAGAYAGVQWYGQKQLETRDAAFIAFQNAELEARPEPLLEVAQEYPGAGAVQELATLTAADLHLNAYLLRRAPGTQGVEPEDRLDDDQAREMLEKAGALYEDAYQEASAATGRELLEISALWGLAAVELSRGNFDAAESRLQQVVEIAESERYAQLVARAEMLINDIPRLRDQRQPVTDLTEDAPAETENAETPEQEPAPAPPTDEPAETDG
jgi:predicted negative regulator of RcsB-dependent stress response